MMVLHLQSLIWTLDEPAKNSNEILSVCQNQIDVCQDKVGKKYFGSCQSDKPHSVLILSNNLILSSFPIRIPHAQRKILSWGGGVDLCRLEDPGVAYRIP